MRKNATMTNVMPLTDTAMAPLWCRASEASRGDGIIDDPLAVSLLDSIEYDFSRFKLSADRQDLALRALAFDHSAHRYLSDHPRATVVALGEGLQTGFWRLDAAGVGHEFRWLTVDLPPNIELRNRLLPRSPRISLCAQSALDFSWMDAVDPDEGVFVSAEGLLPYFEPAEALGLLRECARRFRGGQLMFDLPPKSQAWMAAHPRLWRLLRQDWPRTPFSLSPSELADLNDRVPRVRAVHNLPLPRGRGMLFGRLLPRTERLPVYRPLRRWVGLSFPTIATLALVEFDQ